MRRVKAGKQAADKSHSLTGEEGVCCSQPVGVVITHTHKETTGGEERAQTDWAPTWPKNKHGDIAVTEPQVQGPSQSSLLFAL